MLAGRRRDLAADAAALLWPYRSRLRVVGSEHIPRDGPCALVGNHYERPGLWMAWGTLLVSDAVAATRAGSFPTGRMRWVMTSEWSDYRVGGLPAPMGPMRWLFRRLAATYGFVVLPRAAERTSGRAVAFRRIIASADVIGFYPEGDTSYALKEPHPATGHFFGLLARRGVPLLPVAVFEADGRLVAAFGPPLVMDVADGRDREARDRTARDRVMTALARLMPPALRGPYGVAAEEVVP